jgi:ClpX C4-type zinc finger
LTSEFRSVRVNLTISEGAAKTKLKLLHCSFCGKSERQVARLLAGATAWHPAPRYSRNRPPGPNWRKMHCLLPCPPATRRSMPRAGYCNSGSSYCANAVTRGRRSARPSASRASPLGSGSARPQAPIPARYRIDKAIRLECRVDLDDISCAGRKPTASSIRTRNRAHDQADSHPRRPRLRYHLRRGSVDDVVFARFRQHGRHGSGHDGKVIGRKTAGPACRPTFPRSPQ